jgi:hypothetical protein
MPSIVQCVIQRPAVSGRADPRVFEPVGQAGAQADGHLVVIHRGAVGDRDDQVPQLRVSARDLGVGHDREITQLAALPGEPPLFHQPRR